MAMLGSRNQIVLYGQRTEASTFSLSMLQQNESGDVTETPIDYPCEHVNDNSGMFVVVREGRELLLVACWQCKNIKLVNLEKLAVESMTKLSKHFKFRVFRIWPGPDDTVFVISKDGEIWNLDSSFNSIEKFKCQLGSCESASFLPDALVVRHQCQIKLVSMEKGKELWTKQCRQKITQRPLFLAAKQHPGRQ